jgi:rare lipoprotein A
LAETARAEPGSWSEPHFQSGQASWYGPGFHGRRTASGEIFNTQEKTAAHRTLPFGTRLRVTNQRTGRSTVVRINDRGPYAHGRVIDLSRASAEAIGLLGVASVSLARL